MHVNGSLSTIATYELVDDADIARHALEAAGIEVFLGEELKLRVRNEDAIRAGAVLDAHCAWVGESEVPDEPPPPPPVCECEACEPIRSARASWFAYVAVMTIGFSLAFGIGQAAFFGVLAAAVYFLIADRWRCAECGASWN